MIKKTIRKTKDIYMKTTGNAQETIGTQKENHEKTNGLHRRPMRRTCDYKKRTVAKPSENHVQARRKTVKEPKANNRKTMRKHQDNEGKPQQSQRKTIRKPSDSHRKP